MGEGEGLALALGTQFKRRFEVCVAARSHEGESVVPDRSGKHYRSEKTFALFAVESNFED